MGLKKRSKVSAEFNMSSLTDIIFLLLIFFMLTSSLTSPNAKNIERPVSNSTTPSPQNVSLSITEEGEYYVADIAEPIAYGSLESVLAEQIEKERKEIKAKKLQQEFVTVVLNVSKDERTSTVVDIMKMSNKLGAKLILATEPSQETNTTTN